MAASIDNPIINSPYTEPSRHWELDTNGQPTGATVPGRRPSEMYMPVARARKGSKAAAEQESLFGFDGILETASSNETIAEIRKLVGDWRRGGYQNITPTTRRLLEYWTDDSRSRRLFFAQVEAVETAIYLTEVGQKLGKGWVGESVARANAEFNAGLPRVALKMATGTGKTVVMAMLISWQVLNKVASPQDARFTKKFLLVAPGVTIRDRLRVLMPSDAGGGYYQEMDLVPSDLRPALGQARVAITNFHNFELKTTTTLAATTKKLLLGRRKGADPFVETPAQMVNRVLRDLGGSDKSQIIVINDEAHHCYQTRAAAIDGGKTEDELTGEEKKEAQESNKISRRWFDGLRHISGKVGIKQVYDLSATPSYLTGSGYPSGWLFPWVVSDFSLLDAIESGLVKIPRVPVDDDAAQDQVSYLNLWDSITDEDRKRLAKGDPTPDEHLPAVLDGALKSLYQDYRKSFERWERTQAEHDGSTPPVFIVVCSNMKISKWVYQKISGFEIEGQGRRGELPLFSNYDEHGQRVEQMRTILVNSDEMENPDAQLSTEFKQAAAAALAVFHEEYRQRYPDRGLDTITEKDLLREVLNTVGKPGKLGQHVRCVVSVSMLTEGWDANTVTHILGIRAFGSHLLCEQVVGRGLRRISYDVNSQGLFDPEYAEVYGIPFQFIQTDPAKVLEAKPRPIPVRVRALPERAAQRIVFPRLEGYRVEIADVPYEADFSDYPKFVVNETFAKDTLGSTVLGQDTTYSADDEQQPVRPQQVAFRIAQELMKKVQDPTGAQKPWLFPNLVALSKEWIRACASTDPRALVAISTADEERERAAEQVWQAITRQNQNKVSLAKLLPVFQRYTPEGSTDAVDFFTTKARYEADSQKSPVNYVVLDGKDGNTWERGVAQLLEALPEVASYVKNDHLEFRVPYTYAGRAHWYLPDFIVRLKKRSSDDDDHFLIIEVSGTFKNQFKREAKARTAQDQWCAAVNNHGRYGVWGFIEVDDPDRFRSELVRSIGHLYSGIGTVTGIHADALPPTADGLFSAHELAEMYPDQPDDDALFEGFFITQTAGSGVGEGN